VGKDNRRLILAVPRTDGIRVRRYFLKGMKERPILFSAPMVRAILNGTKTQTRRIINPKPTMWLSGFKKPGIPYKPTNKKPSVNGSVWQEDNGDCYEPIRCQYGQEGDRLWVRETFYAFGRWEYRTTQKKGKDHDGWHFIDKTLATGFGYMYESEPPKVLQSGRGGIGWHKRPSLFMPREASRILLEIVSTRAQRLHDITEQDAIAEGIEPLFSAEEIRAHPELAQTKGDWKNYLWHGHRGVSSRSVDAWRHQYSGYKYPEGSYSSLWELINGPGSWAANPAVWVVESKTITT